MNEVVSYPLTPVPLSLSHVDGSMKNTPKSKLMKYLELLAATDPPKTVDASIIDVMFFLRLDPNLPSTFDGVVRYLLDRISEFEGHILHFVCDKWVHPSFKDCERKDRDKSKLTYCVKGPAQKRPTNWLDALKKNTFKESLIRYLVEAWKDLSFGPILKNKIFYANFNNTCYRYVNSEGSILCEEKEELYSSHEEANSRMFFHLDLISGPSNVVICIDGTDCLVIVLGCNHLFDQKVNIWLEVEVQSKNNLRYINANKIYNQLGETLCKALPAYHALTGCDCSISFCRKGKVQPFKILKKDVQTQEFFGKLANMEELDETSEEVIEKYICKVLRIKLTMYGHRYFWGNMKQRNQRNDLAAQRMNRDNKSAS